MATDLETVESAINNVPDSMPHADAIREILSRAWLEATEDVEHWLSEGKPHLRTFLKTTPLGLAILNLAQSINKG